MAMQLRINARIYILIGLFAVGCGILAFTLNYLHDRESLDARKQAVTQLVDAAIGVLEAHRKLADQGVMSEADARSGTMV